MPQGLLENIESDLISSSEAATLRLSCGCARDALAAMNTQGGDEGEINERPVQLLVKVDLPRRSLLGVQ